MCCCLCSLLENARVARNRGVPSLRLDLRGVVWPSSMVYKPEWDLQAYRGVNWVIRISEIKSDSYPGVDGAVNFSQWVLYKLGVLFEIESEKIAWRAQKFGRRHSMLKWNFRWNFSVHFTTRRLTNLVHPFIHLKWSNVSQYNSWIMHNKCLRGLSLLLSYKCWRFLWAFLSPQEKTDLSTTL